jgi:hypothetical protein
MHYATLAVHQLATMTKPGVHRARERPFASEQAHAVMQFHAACGAEECPRKAAALQALIAAGRVVPSTDKPR